MEEISHRPALSDTLQCSTAELTAMLDHLPTGVLMVDRNCQPLVINRTARELLSSSTMRDARTGALVADEDTPVIRALRGELVPGEEYAFSRGAGGDPRHWRVSGMPLRDQNDEITGAMSVFTDVTTEREHARRTERQLSLEQRARAEADLAVVHLQGELAVHRGAEVDLMSSQQRLRLALDASHMATFDYDVVHDRIEWSAEMSSIVGASLSQLASSLAEGFSYLHPDDRASVEAIIQEALERGKTLQFETRIAYGVQHSLRWLLIKGSVQRDAQDRPLRMFGIALDITERKEAEAKRSSQAHDQRLRAIGEMASGIAHGLNQSLALITGYGEIAHQELDRGQPDVSRVREAIEISTQAALEGAIALRGVLSYVRADDPTLECVDMGSVLHDVARLTWPRWRHAPQAEGRPIDLQVEAECDCPITGSPTALREVMTNLIFNAVDALPGGGVIRLAASVRADQVLVTVSDTGIGMTEDVQARVFDPFFTTKGVRGTGLGLPQVRTIVKQHDGEIEVHSDPGKGTTFVLIFPKATTPAMPSLVASPPIETATGPICTVRILVVEDEQQLARMASLVLAQRGHTVVVATSGEEALAVLDRERFDLVISDLGLGAGKNGWDLAAAVRERWPATRFVLVTGWGAGIDRDEARKRGVDQVIPKPYRIADLRDLADRVALSRVAL